MASCNSEASSGNNTTGTVTSAPENVGRASFKTIGSEEAKALLKQHPDIVLLDVRTPEEFTAGHLQGAQLLNFYDPDFLQRVQNFDTTKTYLVYCAVGGRSSQATQQMVQSGFKQVYNISEGFSALKNAGIPTE